MIAEEYLSRSRLYRRLRNEPHGELIELYAARLTQEGLARHGTWRCLSLVGKLLSWITRSRSKLADLDERGSNTTSGGEPGSSPFNRATRRR
jgi:hypothetical protein